MRRFFALLLFAGLAAFAQTTPITVTATVQNADIVDIYTWSHQQFADPPQVAILAAPMAVGDTTLTLSSTTGLPASGGVVIDSEMILYTAVSGSLLTGLSRGQQQTTAAAHGSGATVHNLLLSTPAALVKYAIARQIAYIRQALGVSSAAIGAALTALQADTATANAVPVVQ